MIHHKLRKMKRTLLILILMLASVSGWAQENEFRVPDSLMMKLKENRSDNEMRASNLVDIIEYHIENRKINLAMPYIKELREMKFYTEGDYYRKALCDYYYACYLCNTNQVQDAMQWIEHSIDALENAMENNYSRRLFVRISLVKGSCLFRLNLFSEEYNCLQDGIEVAEIIADSILLGKLYNNLGLMYQNIFRIDESFESLYKSIRYYTNNFAALLNLGITHNMAKLVDSTYQYFDSAYIYMDYALDVAKDKYDSVSIYHRIGCLKAHDNDYEEALDYLYKAMEVYDQCNSSLYERSIIRREIAIVQKNMGNLDQAMELINEAIQMAEFGEDLKVLCFSYGVRSDIEKRMGNYKAALEDAEKLMETNDKISKLQDGDKLVQNEHDLIKRKAQEQLRFEQFKAKQKQRTTWIVIGILIFFSLTTAIMLAMINRKRCKMLELELNIQNREITSKVMAQMHFNEVLGDVVGKLDEISHKDEAKNGLNHVIKDLKDMVDNGSKKDFDYYFVQIHPDFYKKLSDDFPNLTQNDLRLCAFIKAKMNTKDIAALNNMSADSVKNSRSRLRKKLGITDVNASLSDFVSKY